MQNNVANANLSLNANECLKKLKIDLVALVLAVGDDRIPQDLFGLCVDAREARGHRCTRCRGCVAEAKPTQGGDGGALGVYLA